MPHTATSGFRRVVTGIADDGRSVVVSDGPCSEIFGPADDPHLVNFWATGALPMDYRGGANEAHATMPLSPTKGGVVFRFFRVAPEPEGGGNEASARAAAAAYFHAIGSSNDLRTDGRHAGFHQTETIDFIVLLHGEVTLLLDDADVPLKPFDVVIQRGTRHAWVNHGTETALLMAVLASAQDGATDA